MPQALGSGRIGRARDGAEKCSGGTGHPLNRANHLLHRDTQARPRHPRRRSGDVRAGGGRRVQVVCRVAWGVVQPPLPDRRSGQVRQGPRHQARRAAGRTGRARAPGPVDRVGRRTESSQSVRRHRGRAGLRVQDREYPCVRRADARTTGLGGGHFGRAEPRGKTRGVHVLSQGPPQEPAFLEPSRPGSCRTLPGSQRRNPRWGSRASTFRNRSNVVINVVGELLPLQEAAWSHGSDIRQRVPCGTAEG
ncbi:hypothetical protein STANM309S_05987 [Streptomyces tanashiensis]